MSLAEKFRNLINKKPSGDELGITLHREFVKVCRKQDGAIVIEVEPVTAASNHGQAINKLISEHSLSGRCQLMLDHQQYQVVQIDKPEVPEAEINESLKWLAKDLVTFSPDEMVVDYYMSPVPIAGTVKLNATCANKKILVESLDELREHDIEIVGVTTEEFALTNLVPVTEEAVMLLSQQPGEEVLILIVKHGEIYFSRRLRGYAQIDQRTPEELGYGMLDSLALEIQRSTDYFERQLKQAPLKSIKLLVASEHEDFIVEQLNKNTVAEVTKLVMPTGYESKREHACGVGVLLELAQYG